MAKLTSYSAITSPQKDDLLYLVSDPSGTPVSKKVAVANLLGSFSAKTYGAIGDGITDDTAAIQAAIAAAGTYGTVLFPDGTYISGALTANVVGQRWLLDRGATLKAKTNINDYMITVSATDFVFDGGTVDGNVTNQAPAMRCFNVAAARATLQNCAIQNAKSGLVYINGVDRTRILNCVLSSPGNYGIFNSGAATNLEIRGCRISADATGDVDPIQIHCDSGLMDGVVVADNHIESGSSAGFCIEIIGNSVDFAEHVKVTNNTCVASANHYGGISCGYCDGAIVSGNHYAAGAYTSASGLEFSACRRCVASANYWQCSAGIGALVNDCIRSVVTGNVFDGWGVGVDRSAVQVVGPNPGYKSDDNVVSSNLCIALALTAGIGIWVQAKDATATCDRNVIANNVLVGTGAGTAILLQLDSGTLDSTVVLGNSMSGWTTRVDTTTATNTMGSDATGTSISVAPAIIGQLSVVAGDIYMASDVSSSSDWKKITP